jgi:2-methylcitrate dehydratase PrpD
MNELQTLAEYIVSFDYEALPEKVKSAITYCVLDTLGAALGAKGDGDMEKLTEELLHWAGRCQYMASVWGNGIKTDLHTAVLINGMAGHTLEMDDGHGRAKAHIGVVVVPAAWAMAEALGRSGKELLAACVAGYETMTRIGIGMDVASNRKRGWHTTGIIGTFGAAAACSRLLNLTADETANALGIAATQSAGLWAFLKEGATLKKLNPARAAVNGMEAAILARGGMTGPRHALDASDGGLYRAVSDRFDMREVSLELGQRFETLMIEKKLYPSCASTHHAVDAAVEFAQRGIRPADVTDVLIDCGEVAYIQCGNPQYPKTWVEAKFSIPFTFAAALKYGTLDHDSFTERVLGDPEVRTLAGKVRCAVDAEFTLAYPERLLGRATITLTSGEKIVKYMEGMVGSPAVPITPRQVETKFMSLVGRIYGQAQAEKTLKSLTGIADAITLPTL